MPLKDVRIQELIHTQTLSIFQSLGFKELEQLIIDRKPLAAVVSAIDQILTAELTRDKEAYQVSVTKEACQEQIWIDLAFEKNDPQEESKDNELQEKLTANHCKLRTEFDSFSKTKEGQKEKYIMANAILARLSLVVAIKIKQIAKEQNKARLQSELADYQKQLMTQEITTANEKATLDDTETLHRKMELELNKVIRELVTEIPRRKKAREQRVTELTSRKHARLNDDPDLKQLSWENRLRRNLKIRHFNSQLELIRETSMSIVNSTSYPVFIAQLQLKLDARSDLSLNAAEIDSLKITMFQTACLAMKWQETQLHQLCSEIRTKQHQQQQRLQTAQESRARYNQSNSELSAKNSKLDLQRILLRQQAVSYSANASQQVIACGVTGSIAFAIGLFVLIMTLNPLFFIIPGVFALAALGTLIAGCVFRFKEEASLEQAKINDRQFRTNNQQINKHTSEIKKIDTEIIPVLQQNMSQSTKDLEQASKNRAKHQKKMHAQRNKANIVKDGQASQGGIFSERVTPVLVGSDAVTIDNSNSKRDLPQLASVLAKP